MENNNLSKNYRIIFTEDKFPILDEVIKKYGLEGLDKKALILSNNEKPSPSPTLAILSIINSVVEGKLQTKDIPGFLEEALGLSKKDSSSLSEDIKTKLISICKKVTLEELAKQKATEDVPEKRLENTAYQLATEGATKKLANKKTLGQDDVAEKDQIKKTPRVEPDNYREPIG